MATVTPAPSGASCAVTEVLYHPLLTVFDKVVAASFLLDPLLTDAERAAQLQLPPDMVRKCIRYAEQLGIW